MPTFQRRRVKPRGRVAPNQITGINWNSPFADDFLCVQVPHTRYDLVHGNRHTYYGTPPPRVVATRFGPAWDFDGVDQYIDFFGELTQSPFGPGFCNHVRFMFRTFGNLEGVVGRTAFGGREPSIRLRSSSGQRIECTYGGMYSTDTIVARKGYSAGQTWLDQTTRTFYVDGVANDTDVPPATGLNGLVSLHLIGRDYTNRYFDGQVSLYAEWTRLKSDEFNRDFDANPWDWALTTAKYYSLPDAGGGTNIAAATHAYDWETFAATVNAKRQVAAGVQAYQWTTLQASINAKRQVNAALAGYRWTTYPATVQAEAGNVLASLHSYGWDAHQATVNAKRMISAGVADYRWAVQQANVNAKRQVQAAVHGYRWTTHPATVAAARNVSAATHGYRWTTHRASVSVPTGIQATTHAYGWTTHPATVRVVQDVEANAHNYGWTTHRAQALVNARAHGYRWTTHRARIEPSSDEGAFGVTGPTARHPTLPTRPPR